MEALGKQEKKFDAERQALWDDATNRAKLKRQEILKDARVEADALRMQLQQTMREEHQKLSRDIRDQTHQEVIAISKMVMTDLANQDLEKHIIKIFLDQIKTLSGKQNELLLKALDESTHRVQICSAFKLDRQQKDVISKTISEIAGQRVPLDFKAKPNQISGIEMTAHGYRISWNVEEYLDALERRLAKPFDEKSNLEESTKS